MLTPKQTELLTFIVRYQGGHEGVAPTYQEMADAVNLSGKSGILRLLLGLEERGAIRRLPNRSRAIEVLKDGDGAPTPRRALHYVTLARADVTAFTGPFASAALSLLDTAAAQLRLLVRAAA